MTIKQQGGIFGRNPSFNNVEAQSLTVGGESLPDITNLVTSDEVGTIASQDSDSVDIDGGAVDAVTLGTNSAITDARVDNLQLDGNTISSTDTDGNILLTPNGDGNVGIGGIKTIRKTLSNVSQGVAQTILTVALGASDDAAFGCKVRILFSVRGASVRAFEWIWFGGRHNTSFNIEAVTEIWDSGVVNLNSGSRNISGATASAVDNGDGTQSLSVTVSVSGSANKDSDWYIYAESFGGISGSGDAQALT